MLGPKSRNKGIVRCYCSGCAYRKEKGEYDGMCRDLVEDVPCRPSDSGSASISRAVPGTGTVELLVLVLAVPIRISSLNLERVVSFDGDRIHEQTYFDIEVQFLRGLGILEQRDIGFAVVIDASPKNHWSPVTLSSVDLTPPATIFEGYASVVNVVLSAGRLSLPDIRFDRAGDCHWLGRSGSRENWDGHVLSAWNDKVSITQRHESKIYVPG